MKPIALLALLLCAVPAMAKPVISASSPAEADARRKAVASIALLSADNLDWQIFVISDKDWREGLSQNRHQTDLVVGSAYTLSEKHITYLNASWVMANSEERIAHTLAHEWGHILCGCFDEKMADRQGQRILSH